jgi:hypothetical protein
VVDVASEIGLGPIPVRTGAREVGEFARAVANGGADAAGPLCVPPTFPVRWLTTGPVRERVLAQTDGHDLVLLRQEFDYQTALQIDADYQLRVTIERASGSQGMLTVRGALQTLDGANVMTVTSALRLVPRGAEGRGAA